MWRITETWWAVFQSSWSCVIMSFFCFSCWDFPFGLSCWICFLQVNLEKLSWKLHSHQDCQSLISGIDLIVEWSLLNPIIWSSVVQWPWGNLTLVMKDGLMFPLKMSDYIPSAIMLIYMHWHKLSLLNSCYFYSATESRHIALLWIPTAINYGLCNHHLILDYCLNSASSLFYF